MLTPFRKIENPVVLYHANCADGFCAAWLIWRRCPTATFMPVSYNEPPPWICKGRDVIVADFSYPNSQMQSLRSDARNLVVLDHHKTAKAELDGLDYCQFDMEKSGARLVKEYISDPPNWLVDYTEDRDLWRWLLKDSKAVNAALRSYPMEFETWNNLYAGSYLDLIAEGRAILRDQDQRIQEAVAQAWEVTLDGTKVKCVNATSLISEIAGELAKGQPFGICFFETGTHRVYSLRSSKYSGVDVSAIAKKFGGGGHANAAGFKIPFDLAQDLLNLNSRKI